MPATLDVHETVAVPEPVMLAGVIVPQVNPAGTIWVSETVPAKPFRAVMVMVDVANVLTVTAAGEVAEIVKSWTVNVAVVL